MSKLVGDFKALTLSQQHETYPAITAVYNAAKEVRRLELEAEIRQLGFRPGDAVKKPPAAVKYRSRKDATKTWAGRGAEPTWLKAEMAESGLKLEDYRAT
jgi:DNA-binding protein H-NS